MCPAGLAQQVYFIYTCIGIIVVSTCMLELLRYLGGTVMRIPPACMQFKKVLATTCISSLSLFRLLSPVGV